MLNRSGSDPTTLWTQFISCHKPDGTESGCASSRHKGLAYKQLAETLLASPV